MAFRTITIQPTETKDDPLKLPYPYHIRSTAMVGRQEFWKGNPAKLVGFSGTKKAGSIKIEFKEFWDNPTLAEGKYPVFEKSDGTWYTMGSKIKNVRISE